MLFFEWLDLTWDLSFGLRARLNTYNDWIIYNEIFVHGEYDRALRLALDAVAGDASPIHIVDIGANVGFFTLRAAQRVMERGWLYRGFTITAVEGNVACIKEFHARIFGENGLSGTVTLTHGLVGKRVGRANFYGDSIFDVRDLPAVTASYVDLDPLLAAAPQIALLKCDIEGAELLFIENYPDLLRKVAVAVFEFHANLCDTNRCQKLLRDYGFTHGEVFRAGDPFYVYCAWR